MIELYQAEWCPYSSAVRERLTELGLDFVARQVPPWPEQRTALVERAGVDSIPVLVVDGDVHVGTREIFAFLDGLEAPPAAAEHRGRYHEHAPARHKDVPGRLLDRAAPVDSPA
ncbi:MAG: glutaredoxin family protein [Gaiellaceae bacterium]